MPRFKKKPIVIEAFQMTPESRVSNRHWPEWLNRAWNFDRGEPGSVFPTEEGIGNGTVSIGTLEGEMRVDMGDWIIKGVQGELYPCKPEIFAATYDSMTE